MHPWSPEEGMWHHCPVNADIMSLSSDLPSFRRVKKTTKFINGILCGLNAKPGPEGAIDMKYAEASTRSHNPIIYAMGQDGLPSGAARAEIEGMAAWVITRYSKDVRPIENRSHDFVTIFMTSLGEELLLGLGERMAQHFAEELVSLRPGDIVNTTVEVRKKGRRFLRLIRP